MPGSSDLPAPPALDQNVTLEQERAFLEKAQEVAHIGSWVAELDDSRKVTWSAETYRIFGVSPEEFPGTIDGLIRLVHPDDEQTVGELMRSAIAERKPLDIEHRIVRAGDIRWVHERADVIVDRNGAPVRVIGTVQDVTARRALELQLRHAQKMDAIGRLAGGVAHDLNNALTTIAGYTELALSELADTHPARSDVEEIRRAAARAEAVTRKLLAFSRRQQLFESREFDLNDVIQTLTRLLDRTLGDNVALRTQLAPGLPPVTGDPGQIEQAIVNLAVNARDAMPDGGTIVITTSLETVTGAFAVRHAPMPLGQFVLLKVADSGHGIDRETQARIFEPFFTTKGPAKGTGLGLAMVYGTVKQSNGFVFVDSDVGRGATFSLYFPVGRAPAKAAESETEGVDALTVLVAEDEPSILNLIATTLRRDGYHVLKAASATEALNVAASHSGSIDLLLTDSMMPGMSGPELARSLLAAHPKLPVILMSGNIQALSGIETISETIVIMQKPFTPTELRDRVRAVLKA